MNNTMKYGSSGADVEWLHDKLSAILGYPVDQPMSKSYFGEVLDSQVRKFQTLHDLKSDGIVGDLTMGYLSRIVDKKSVDTIIDEHGRVKAKYLLTNKDLSDNSYKGRLSTPTPTGDSYLTQVQLPYAMRLAWDTSILVTRQRMHHDIAKPLTEALSEILRHYGLDKIKALGLDLYGGIFNYRKIRGGSIWSSHAYGIAIDINPEGNKFRSKPKHTTFANPEMTAFADIMVKHGFATLEHDLQHWQYTARR